MKMIKMIHVELNSIMFDKLISVTKNVHQKNIKVDLNGLIQFEILKDELVWLKTTRPKFFFGINLIVAAHCVLKIRINSPNCARSPMLFYFVFSQFYFEHFFEYHISGHK